MSYEHGTSTGIRGAAAIPAAEQQVIRLRSQIRTLQTLKAEQEHATKAARTKAAQDIAAATTRADRAIRQHNRDVWAALHTVTTIDEAERVRLHALATQPEPVYGGPEGLKDAVADIDRHNRECATCRAENEAKTRRTAAAKAQAAA